VDLIASEEEDHPMDPLSLSNERETLQIVDVREIERNRPVAVICRSGNRSAMATDWLRRQGVDARNVHGGMIAWNLHGLPLVSDDGSRGRVA
jgi:rhodanese-related sulfurtransferase